jgi:3-dehydroquinate synthase
MVEPVTSFQLPASSSPPSLASGNWKPATAMVHPVIVATGSIDRIATYAGQWSPAARYGIISDSNVAPLYGARVQTTFAEAALEADVLTIPAGENQKTRDTWATLTDELLSTGFGRDSVLIALGGGVICDLVGFVAATYLRGVPVIHVPTTLMAMVDAAIGGKTGVDTAAGKNLVGAFHLPAGVIVDPEVLATLPLRELQSGLAEVLKHGAIADADYFGRVVGALPQLLSTDLAKDERLAAFIARSIEIKSAIVSEDPRESGLRKILNFGHTLGHAIEAASDYSLLHGEAVAIGMLAESVAAERAGVTSPGTSQSLKSAVVAAGLPARQPSEVPVERIMQIARIDKKVRRGMLEFAVPRCIGEMAGADSGWTIRLPATLVREVLAC